MRNFLTALALARDGGELVSASVDGSLRVWNTLTGRLLRTIRAGLGSIGTPWKLALSPDGTTLVVTTGEDAHGYDGDYNRAVVSLDPLTLEVLQANKQATPGLDLDFGTSPVIFRDGQGRTLVGANEKSGVFYAYVLADLAAGPLWQRPLGISVGMMPAYDPGQGGGGTLFVAGDNGQLFALDPATGADRYPPLALGFMHANMAIANGLVFVSTGGQVLILDGANGRLLRTLAPANAGASFSGVVVAGGFVYWLSGPYLNAWGLS